jgi:UTP:GlnB (protein PII) uridylyltransferase
VSVDLLARNEVQKYSDLDLIFLTPSFKNQQGIALGLGTDPLHDLNNGQLP